MATAYVPELNAEPRQIGRGIVMAGDRNIEFEKARRRSAVIRVLRLALPASAALVLVGYGLTILKAAGWGTALPEVTIKRILPEDLAMNNPHYEGFGDDGSSYKFTAKTARQELANPALIKLDAISGTILEPDKSKTEIAAVRGVFDHEANVLDLFDQIDVVSQKGLKAKLTRATILTKESLITSTEPVYLEFPSGNIRAKSMRLRQKAREATFADTVQVELIPPAEDNANAEPAADYDGLFAPSNGPVKIDAQRLDVNDSSQIAIFTGNVKVAQADAVLTTPELEVTYEGGGMMSMGRSRQNPREADDPDASDASGSAASKIRRIVAKAPVVMKRGENEIVTSDNADFDVPSETAILTGNVVMSSGVDRRVVSDRVDLNQRADTALLTGNVVVTQGENELSGGRLLIERKAGRAQLTTPPALGSGPGRIYARLVRDDAKPPSQKAPNRGEAGSLASFKTDPNAPVNVEADQLDVDDAAKVAIFRGDVRADQGGFVINSAELQAYYTGNAGLADVTRTSPGGTAGERKPTELTRIMAKKNVFITSSEGRTASGDWAEFNAKTNMITMGGDVVLTQGDNMVRGTRLVIDMTTGQTRIDTAPAKTVAQPSGGGWVTEGPSEAGVENGGRASAVFFPQQLKSGQPSKGTSKASSSGANAGPTIDGWSTIGPP